MLARWRWVVGLASALQVAGCGSDPEPTDSNDARVLPNDAGGFVPGPGQGGSDGGVVPNVGSDGAVGPGPASPDGATPSGPNPTLDGGRADASAANDGSTTPIDASPRADASTDASGGGSDSAVPAPSCSGTSTLRAGNSPGSLMVGGVKRDYLLHVPSSYTGKSPVPLLLDFHPLLMDAAFQRDRSGYAAVADQEGFIVAYPDGVDPAWNVGPCCTRSRTTDDLGFAKALVAKLISEGCIDTKRVYAAGFSNGGGMAHHVACNAADIFAAVAPAAFDLLVEAEQPCKPARPISVLSFRSTNDNTVPYAGGASTPPTVLLGYSLNQIHFLGAQGTFMRWSQLNQCTGTPEDTATGCKTYKQCAAGTEVTLCTSSSAGHATGPAAQGWATLKRFTLP
jgi:polyhydroxybutyrate depolymerase